MNILKIIKRASGYAIVAIGAILMMYFYTNTFDFGAGWIGMITGKLIAIGIASVFSLGFTLVMWSLRSKRAGISVLIETFAGGIAGFAFVLWAVSVYIGVPMDANYALGINAVMISKSIIILSPLVPLGVGTVIFLIYRPESFFWGVVQVGAIVLLTVVTGVYVSPALLAAI